VSDSEETEPPEPAQPAEPPEREPPESGATMFQPPPLEFDLRMMTASGLPTPLPLPEKDKKDQKDEKDRDEPPG
jgi:hypothetical protein